MGPLNHPPYNYLHFHLVAPGYQNVLAPKLASKSSKDGQRARDLLLMY